MTNEEILKLIGNYGYTITDITSHDRDVVDIADVISMLTEVTKPKTIDENSLNKLAIKESPYKWDDDTEALEIDKGILLEEGFIKGFKCGYKKAKEN